MTDNDNGTTDEQTDEIQPYGKWADELSKGELRRLQQHLSEADDRLAKARNILDDAGLIDAWQNTRKGDTGNYADYGFIYSLTSARAHASDVYQESLDRYNERREGEQ